MTIRSDNDRLPLQQGPAPFIDLAPGLLTLGVETTATRGERLSGTTGSGLMIVTRGTLCQTHGDTGLCTALVGEGLPVGPVRGPGKWLTDGAARHIPFDDLARHYGAAAALEIWMRTAEVARIAIEGELVCLVRHTAARRLARWLLVLMNTTDCTHLIQAELAELSGLQRTSVCAAMTALQARGALKVMRGRISLASRSALEQEACGCGARPATGALRLDSPVPGEARDSLSPVVSPVDDRAGWEGQDKTCRNRGAAG